MSVTPTGREDGDIQAILRDSGLEEDADLCRTLEDLRALAQEVAPAPRADLAALLTPGVSSLELRRRSRKRRMGVVVSAAVVGAMGLGAGAVAASSEDFRQSIDHTVVRFFQPADEATAPKTDMGSPSPAGLPAPSAVSPAPSPTTAAPSPTAPATPAARVTPAPSSRAASGEKPDKAAAERALPTQLPVVPGNGTRPQLPSKPQPVVPTLPGAVPAPSPGNP
jgi:cytoskeletal protein RodZ